MDRDDHKEKMLMEARRDQAWAALRELQPQIQAILQNGIGSPQEAAIVKRCVQTVNAELDYRKSEIE